jgi:hypothetical protein
MFVAHAAAIAEVWLALAEHGPATGVEVTGWLTDRAGWQEWTRTGRWSSHPLRLTPDAVATLSVDGRQSAAFVEVDLASMTQTILKQKVARYLAYAEDLAWQDRYPYCPPMLLLTTTATRAASFVRVAGQVISKHRQRLEGTDPAAMLVVAACGLVRDPARAVIEPCWALSEAAVADLTLAEILAERAEAKQASAAWAYERDVVQRRRNDIDDLRSIAQFQTLADWMGSAPAAEVLRVLIGADPGAFLDTEPDLADLALDWFAGRRRLGRTPARDLARPLVAALEPRHADLWDEQGRRVLAAKADIADEQPRLCRLAAMLADGRLAKIDQIAALDTPFVQTREEIQRALLGDYQARRASFVDDEWSRRHRRDRRGLTREHFEADYDESNLGVCETCALVYPLPADGSIPESFCAHCKGTILAGQTVRRSARSTVGSRPSSSDSVDGREREPRAASRTKDLEAHPRAGNSSLTACRPAAAVRISVPPTPCRLCRS